MEDPDLDLAVELEDGELDLSDVEYNPLPRPTEGLDLLQKVEASNVSSRQIVFSRSASITAYSSDSDLQESSDSDDSDGPKRSKVPRMRPNLMPTHNTAQNKYSIWSQHLQESVLNEQLLNCDVDSAMYDKSRNVESYNYTSAFRFDEREEQKERSVSPFSECSRPNKRHFKERGNVKLRLGQRRCSPTEDTKGPSREILDLKVTEADTPEDIACDIANKLYEEKESLILKTIQVLGAEKAISLFTKTKNIEGDGGMMILNGARRRTPGGVFLFLLRTDDSVTQEQKNVIFEEEHKAQFKKRRRDRTQKRRENTRAKMEALKQEGLVAASVLPKLLTRAELVQQLAENSEQSQMHVEGWGESDKRLEDSDEMEKGGDESDGTEKCGEEGVSNPPPSPATDNRENSSDEVPELGDRKLLSYADDFLDIGTDDMDVF